MKKPRGKSQEALDQMRKQICGTAPFQAHLRANEPNWAEVVGKLHLPISEAKDLTLDLQRLWLLPFADVPAVADLLFFQYSKLPGLREGFAKAKDTRSLRLCGLFDLFVGMAMQGNSIFPQNPTHLARQIQLALDPAFGRKDGFDPLLDLLLDVHSGQPSTGFNVAEAADLGTIIQSEHERREGVAEGAWKAKHKFDDYKRSLLDSPEFLQDWAAIKRHFKVAKFRDSREIIRRTRTPERNWQMPVFPNLQLTQDRFQVAFDFFCWKWFLWGMRGEEPMVEKLSCVITPYGTQISIPGYWSFDAARDVDWKKFLRLHHARGVNKQGVKLHANRKDRAQQLERLRKANEEAQRTRLRGDARYAFLKQQAGLVPETDDAQVRRMLRMKA
ncbi:MAG: hypothetical protein NT154_14795 [Verrucomicrobia bacterium]|nr:hypothetical protein [Verrucomicrobiota bacterium]